MLNRRGGGALRLDGTYRLGESRRRAALRRQLRVQGPASGPHRLIGQSTHKRAALTWHQKECIASRGSWSGTGAAVLTVHAAANGRIVSAVPKRVSAVSKRGTPREDASRSPGSWINSHPFGHVIR